VKQAKREEIERHKHDEQRFIILIHGDAILPDQTGRHARVVTNQLTDAMPKGLPAQFFNRQSQITNESHRRPLRQTAPRRRRRRVRHDLEGILIQCQMQSQTSPCMGSGLLFGQPAIRPDLPLAEHPSGQLGPTDVGWARDIGSQTDRCETYYISIVV
jgi:hypothetical protein